MVKWIKIRGNRGNFAYRIFLAIDQSEKNVHAFVAPQSQNGDFLFFSLRSDQTIT